MNEGSKGLSIAALIMGILSMLCCCIGFPFAIVGIILAIIVRFLVLAVVLIIAGVTYFKFDKHIFNLFAVIGGYLCPLIIYVIINIKEVKKK